MTQLSHAMVMFAGRCICIFDGVEKIVRHHELIKTESFACVKDAILMGLRIDGHCCNRVNGKSLIYPLSISLGSILHIIIDNKNADYYKHA